MTATPTPLREHWLRARRHLRSVGTSPRARRDADRALAAAAASAEAARGCLCRCKRRAA